MSLSLGIDIRLSADGRWWDRFREAGVSPAFVADYENNQYYNVVQKTLDGVSPNARTTTKDGWDESGNIVNIGTTTNVIEFDPVTLERLGVVTEGNDIDRINTFPIINIAANEWFNDGATGTNLGLSVLGVFSGVSISSNGNLTDAVSENKLHAMTSGQTFPQEWEYRAGTSGKVRIRHRDQTTGNNTLIDGTVGSISVSSSAAGTISDLTEVLLSDGLTYRLTYIFTPNFTNDMQRRIGPFTTTSSETVIALGAFIGAAGQKLPACPIVQNNGSTVTIAGDELTIGPVPSGVELTVDGGFDLGNTDEWTAGSGSVLSVVAGRMRVTNDTGGGFGIAVNTHTVVSGRSYRIVVDVVAGTVNGTIAIGSSFNTNDLGQVTNITGTQTFNVVATSTTISVRCQTQSAPLTDFCDFDNVSVQELVPFVGFNPDEGTIVFVGNWVHNASGTAFMLVGDTSNERFTHQVSANADVVNAFDGTNSIGVSGFSDNTDTVVVMSWKKGARFNILIDGGAENDDPLTGDMYTTLMSIMQLSGSNGGHGGVIRILYYATQFDLATRQGISV